MTRRAGDAPPGPFVSTPPRLASTTVPLHHPRGAERANAPRTLSDCGNCAAVLTRLLATSCWGGIGVTALVDVVTWEGRPRERWSRTVFFFFFKPPLPYFPPASSCVVGC